MPKQMKRSTTQGTPAARPAWRRWLGATSGNLTIELGFVLSLLVLLIVGTYDFGRLALRHMAAISAARAGAQYGIQDFITAADINGMVSAALADAADPLGTVSATARQFCACPGAGEVACTASCPGGDFSVMYVDVTVQDSIDLLFDYPGLQSPWIVTTNARMRVR